MASASPNGCYPARVDVRPLSIAGAWHFTPILRPDDRGVFLESFTSSACEDTIGRPFDLKQMNISVSRKGTVRGIHFADVPPGQAKYVQCFEGRILDVVVDIRVGSPTFGRWDAVELDAESRCGLFVAEGLGHAFRALSPSVTVGYLCNEQYAPSREHGINPLDPELGLPWSAEGSLLSPKDAAAPSLAEAVRTGLVPEYGACVSWYRENADR